MQNIYSTNDFSRCVFLHTQGFHIIKTEKAGSQVTFCFLKTPELDQALNNFLANHPVPIQNVFQSTKLIKSIIYDG